MNKPVNTAILLIPVYQPGAILSTLVQNCITSKIEKIIIVNDGSTQNINIFDELKKHPEVEVLTHATNLGKGAALKTGMNFCMVHYPESKGIITADADGQHSVQDIVRLKNKFQENSDQFILGTRKLSENVPFRSWFGNKLTAAIFFIILGRWLNDTQTGLRAIPYKLALKSLRLTSNAYEFELDMLILARMEGMNLSNIDIQTIYIDHNRSSHFNPITDSLKIYFVFFRFVSASLITACADYMSFLICILLTGNLGLSTILARVVGVMINYPLGLKIVFKSKNNSVVTLLKYLTLVATMGFCSYGLIRMFVGALGVEPIIGKALAEILLYLPSFTVQRELIFSPRRDRK